MKEHPHIDIPDFKSERERQQWFIQNAHFWTAISRRSFRNERTEWKTRADAVAYATQTLKSDPQARPFMIYAVVNGSDTFVENVIRKE